MDRLAPMGYMVMLMPRATAACQVTLDAGYTSHV
jgi:hypothetical protein